MQGPRQIPPGRRSFHRPPAGTQHQRAGGPPGREPSRYSLRKSRITEEPKKEDAPPTHWIYLHGLGSSPRSRKAQFFRGRFESAGLSFIVPDLNVPSFEKLTVSAILDAVDETIGGLPADTGIGIIGSSLGGLAAIFAAHRHERVRRLLLLAPAFGLFRTNFLGLGQAAVKRWEQNGYQEFFHYGTNEMRRVHAGFVADAKRYDETSIRLTKPTIIVHGTRDESVDPHLSVYYAHARRNVTLHLVDDDHSLLASCTQIWDWLWKDIRPR